MSSQLPPSYVNTPVPVAYAAGVDDAIIVTMTRILGLCWEYDYRRTPALTPDQLAELTGRSRSALYRHLSVLEKELRWLQIDRAGRQLILRPLITIANEDRASQDDRCQRGPTARPSALAELSSRAPWPDRHRARSGIPSGDLRSVSEASLPQKGLAKRGTPQDRQAERLTEVSLKTDLADEPIQSGRPVNEELLQALSAASIEDPTRDRLARQDIDPSWVRGWQLWAQHPHRQSLTNPAGNIIRKLEAGRRPPGEYLRQARAEARSRATQHLQPQEDENTDPGEPEPEVDEELHRARKLWDVALAQLRLQMTQATFDAWLRDSQVIGGSETLLIIGVRNRYAVDWLQNRLLKAIQRTLSRLAGQAPALEFQVRD